MEQAINAYERITVTTEFQEKERQLSRARHNEASAIYNAEQRGEQRGMEEERVVWQGVVADKDAELERLRAELTAIKAKSSP